MASFRTVAHRPTGRHLGHRDLVGPDLLREDFQNPVHAALARRVGGLCDGKLHRHLGVDADVAAPLLLLHRRDEGLGEGHVLHDAGAELVLVVGDRLVKDRLPREDLRDGVCHHDVGLAESGVHGILHREDATQAPHVRLKDARAHAQILQLRLQLPCLRGIGVVV